ncbi:hypothetical protein V866_005920 [Kwoniella sp. B9012]
MSAQQSSAGTQGDTDPVRAPVPREERPGQSYSFITFGGTSSGYQSGQAGMENTADPQPSQDPSAGNAGTSRSCCLCGGDDDSQNH